MRKGALSCTRDRRWTRAARLSCHVTRMRPVAPRPFPPRCARANRTPRAKRVRIHSGASFGLLREQEPVRLRGGRKVVAAPSPHSGCLTGPGSSRTVNAATMIGQKTLLSFFAAAPGKKRSRSPEPGETAEACTPKRSKADTASPQSPPLSPDQLERIRRNKEAALQRLATRTNSLVPADIGQSWRISLSEEFSKPYFSQLLAFVAEERKRHTVYPPPHQVFTWTQMCDIHDVKVVILGQDPYHGPNQAHGLCFSVQKPVPPPPSLENIYKELATDIEGFSHPGHGDLTGWAKQGVLLLNAVLTVRAHQATSHKEKGWEQFTDAVVSWLNKNLDGLVFMLWGAYAQKKGNSIDRKRHHVLQTAHPSPFSVQRGFFGCKHFSKTNELLQKSGKKPIDWRAL